MKRTGAIKKIEKWFSAKGWEPFDFQRDTWNAFLDGKSGLVHASTGTGKTYSAWLGPVIGSLISDKKSGSPEKLKVLWITPLRALAKDTQKALKEPVESLGLNWTVEIRTGDTPTSIRQKQNKRLPTTLITTPESLSLLLSYKDSENMFSGVTAVIVDEWHELMSSKRGVMTELVLARLRKLNPGLRTWGLSATLGNTKEAMEVLLGNGADDGIMIRGLIPKILEIESLIPEEIEKFPKAGHLGVKLLPKVLEIIHRSKSVLIFTNTRSQTEIWFQSLLEADPELAGIIALHHGSLDKKQRAFVEDGLRSGYLKCVVCTSSLDLGVDFSPVDKVIQIGSIKGIARMMQRAGRSGHDPGRSSKIIFVPTNSFELVELAAVRTALKDGYIEPRIPIMKPLDLLSQHLVTVALGAGFSEEEMFEEIRSTFSYKDLNRKEWENVLNFITMGGQALKAYPEYSKVVEADGIFSVYDQKIARRHRMSVGTITSDSAMMVKYVSGGFIGTIEESFISKLKKGDTFVFAGRVLEYIRIRDMIVQVRRATKNKGKVPQWMGGRMPLSTELSSAVRKKLEDIGNGKFDEPETKALIPLMRLQDEWSAIPASDQLLIEKLKLRDGYHVFIYPFEGYLVHEGLSALLGYRMGKLAPISFSMSVNDYGFEFFSDKEIPIEDAIEKGIFSTKELTKDVLESINSAEMAKRQFREIARVAGLVFSGYPGSSKSTKQLQASSGLFYDVFSNYEPDNFLLKQAIEEVLNRQLEFSRIKTALDRMEKSEHILKEIKYPTPLAFPIMVGSLRARLTSEKLADRLEKMTLRLEKATKKK